MSDPSSPVLPGGGEDPRECAKQIADQIAPMMRVARSKRFDFLAYLLAMALREARRLSQDDR
jgi:ADP-heptose:LPS heptosyltransferase